MPVQVLRAEEGTKIRAEEQTKAKEETVEYGCLGLIQ